MTEHELLRIIAFLERVRQPFQELIPIAEEDATWNLLLFLIKNHLTGTPVAISTLASVAKAPHATAMRRIHALIERGDILQETLGEGSKRFKLRPSEALLESFIQYARRIKFLLAETFGLRSKVDSDEDFYFGGSYFAAQIIPPPRLIESLFRGRQEIQFLLNDDNYFLSMRNMWADFRNNMASRKNFDLRKLPQLHSRLVENAGTAVSEYDIVAINAPWLGEAVKKKLVIPLDEHIKSARLSSLARPAIRRSNLLHDRIARGAHRPVRKGQNRISDDFREDYRGRQTFPCTRQGTFWHRLEWRARHADRLDFHVSDGLLRRVYLAYPEGEPWNRR
jgi:multiple sugar transport system substrate-binding protein